MRAVWRTRVTLARHAFSLPVQVHAVSRFKKTDFQLSALFSSHAHRMTDESLHVLLAGDISSPCAPSGGHASPLPTMHSSSRTNAHGYRGAENKPPAFDAVFSPCTPPGGRISLLCCLLATFSPLARHMADACVHPRPPCILLSRVYAHGYRGSKNKPPAFYPVFSPRVSRRTNLSIMLLAGNVFSPCAPSGGRTRSPSPAMHSPFPRKRTRVS